MKKVRILIVEDEALIEMHLRDMLSSRDYEIMESADSAEMAVEKARTGRPDLILMDIILPGGMDGIEASSIIRDELEIPVVYVTASADEENLRRAKDTMPYGYLIKPVKEYELYTTIETALHRHGLERQIKKNEAFASSLLMNSPNPVIVINPDRSIRYINPAMERLSGFSHDEVMGSAPPYPWWPEKSYDQHKNFFDDPAGIGAMESVLQIRNREGEPLWVIRRQTAVMENGEVSYLLVNLVDITARKRLEEQVLEISEQERIRIGHDLHDGIGQEMTAIGFLLGTLAGRLEKDDIPPQDEIKKVVDMVDSAKNHVRMLARGLSPVSVDRDGLVIAVKELAENAGKIFGISCSFEYGDPGAMDNATATHIYYIIQESLHNAVRHGMAKNVSIILNKNPSKIFFSIVDDGIGLKDEPEHRGIGLDLMRYRAEIIGGILNVNRRRPSGTMVTCFINMPENKSSEVKRGHC